MRNLQKLFVELVVFRHVWYGAFSEHLETTLWVTGSILPGNNVIADQQTAHDSHLSQIMLSYASSKTLSFYNKIHPKCVPKSVSQSLILLK